MKAFVLLMSICAVGAVLDRMNARVVDNNTTILINKDGSLTYKFPNGTLEHAIEAKPRGNVEWRNDTFYLDNEPDGWRSSVWTWGTSFNFFNAVWRVPATPSNTDGQCLFFFNSFENNGNNQPTGIMQPVLQYNCNGQSGWALASWYGSSQYTHSTPVPCNPGDSIDGNIQLINNQWYITGFINGQQRTQIGIANNGQNPIYYNPQNSAQCALEVYGVQGCNDYPPDGSITWSNLVITDQGNSHTNNWGPSNNPSNCGDATSCSNDQTCTTRY